MQGEPTAFSSFRSKISKKILIIISTVNENTRRWLTNGRYISNAPLMCYSAFDSHVNNYWINKFKKKKKKKRIINQCGGDFVIDAIFDGDSNDDDKIIGIFSMLVYLTSAALMLYNSRPIDYYTIPCPHHVYEGIRNWFWFGIRSVLFCIYLSWIFHWKWYKWLKLSMAFRQFDPFTWETAMVTNIIIM
jgi:hypothetical protein